MATMVASGNNQLPSSSPLQDSGHRNKRKFRMDPPLSDPCKIIQNPVEYPNYEYSTENSANYIHCNPHRDLCDSCNTFTCPQEDELEMDDYTDVDWTDPTEAQLENLVMMNLHMIFKSAILMISSYGYDKEIATKAVIRSGICYGCKDTVYNIVDNALALLSNGKDIDSSKEHLFENLFQLEKYVLAEMVCVLREVRPFFSTGDAMWCLLICDMNVSHACAMDVEPLSGLKHDRNSNTPVSSSITRQSGTKFDQSKSTQHSSHIATQTQMPPVTGIPSLPSMRFSSSSSGRVLQSSSNLSKARQHVSSQSMVEEFKQACMSEEKFFNGKKGRGGSKRESILHHKSVHSEKSYRAYKSKATLRSSKISNLGNWILDKKSRSSSDSSTINLKSASLKKNKSVGVDVFQDQGNTGISFGAGGPPSLSFSSKTVSSQSALPTTSTELSLSISSKCKNITANTKAITDNLDLRSYSGMPKFEKMSSQWPPHDKKDEMMFVLIPRVRELQAQLLEWTDWAQQKIMQAARRLNKNKSELQTLRHEKDEVFRLKKEKQTLEENTVKKLKEMENALSKATRQVEKANASSRRLEIENARLTIEMDAAKLRAEESATNFHEVSKREMKTQKNSQSWEREKMIFRDEIMAEKRKCSELQKQLEQPKAHLDLLEVPISFTILYQLYCFLFHVNI